MFIATTVINVPSKPKVFTLITRVKMLGILITIKSFKWFFFLVTVLVEVSVSITFAHTLQWMVAFK